MVQDLKVKRKSQFHYSIVMIYADEIGTIPKIGSFEMMMMLSAGRSKKYH
ncbi:hypothetical protein [Sporosalibacterium faouarense]|nr:hypothetical protein [Sporosalibacterium faouarense]